MGAGWGPSLSKYHLADERRVTDRPQAVFDFKKTV
jgi:hypothetical protein